MAGPVPPLNRRLVAPGALLLAGAAAAGLLMLRDDTSATVAGQDRFRITYDVVDSTTGSRTAEVIEVDRPLRSRRLTGPGGSTASATTESGVYERTDGTWRQLAVVPPGEVGQDLRLLSPLRWAEEHGFTRSDGLARFAGRRCTWWVTREPLDLAPFAAATTDDVTRSCVDDGGLLLAEEWRGGGRDLRRRTATEVRALEEVTVLDGRTPQPLAPELAVVAAQVTAGPVDDLVQLAAPPGLTWLAGAKAAEVQPGTTEVVKRSVRAVFVGTAGGGDVLVVDQVRGPLDARGVAVQLGSLGTGHVQATGGGLVVTVPIAEQQWLRVRSSLPYDELAAWLSGLRRAQ